MNVSEAPFNHPEFQRIMNLGCKNRISAVLAFDTFMELCEVHELWYVEYHYLPEFDIIYFTAKHKQNSEFCDVYVPVLAKNKVSPQRLQQVQSAVENRHSQSRFILVIKSADGSSCCYKMSAGLSPPSLNETPSKKKCFAEKRQAIITEIKNRSN